VFRGKGQESNREENKKGGKGRDGRKRPQKISCYGLAPTSQTKILNAIEFGALPCMGGASIEIVASKNQNPKYVAVGK